MNLGSLMGAGASRVPDFSAMQQKLFAKADTDANQKLSLDEFQAAGQKLPIGKGQSAEKVKEAFGKIDSDGDGALSQGEMTSFAETISSQMQAMMLAMQEMMSGAGGFGAGQGPDPEAMFGTIDKDGNGAVSRAEFDQGGNSDLLAQLLGEESDDAFGSIDSDGDGSLSQAEFKAFGERIAEQLPGGSGNGAPPAEFLKAINAYQQGSGSPQDQLTKALLKMLDEGGKQNGTDKQA